MTDRMQMIAELQDLIRRFECGELTSAVLHVEHSDGTRQDFVLGFDTDDERDAALARMFRMLGELH